MIKFQSYERRNLFEVVPDLKNKTMLDIGAGGSCAFCCEYVAFLDRNPENKNSSLKENLVALDKKYSRKSYTIMPEISICSSALKIPFRDESFDICAMGWIIDILERQDLEKVFRESVRVLKPKGYLIGDSPLYPGRGYLQKHQNIRNMRLFFDRQKHLEQVKEYEDLVKAKGLKILKDGTGFDSMNTLSPFIFYFVAQKV